MLRGERGRDDGAATWDERGGKTDIDDSGNVQEGYVVGEESGFCDVPARRSTAMRSWDVMLPKSVVRPPGGAPRYVCERGPPRVFDDSVDALVVPLTSVPDRSQGEGPARGKRGPKSSPLSHSKSGLRSGSIGRLGKRTI